MPAVVYAFLSLFGALFRSQLSLRLENVALRHQLAIYQRIVKRPSIRPADRIFWSWLSRRWASWRHASEAAGITAAAAFTLAHVGRRDWSQLIRCYYGMAKASVCRSRGARGK